MLGYKNSSYAAQIMVLCLSQKSFMPDHIGQALYPKCYILLAQICGADSNTKIILVEKFSLPQVTFEKLS